MQPMRMDTMHDLLWRENQVIVTFHSDTPLVSSDGVNNAPTILKQLDLDSQILKDLHNRPRQEVDRRPAPSIPHSVCISTA